jgi:transposase-like protein
MKTNELSTEDEKLRQEVLKLAASGKAPKEIAEKTGVDVKKIYNWVHYARQSGKMEKTGTRTKHSPQFRAKIVEEVDHIGGYGQIAAIAAKHKLPPSTVRSWYAKEKRDGRRAMKVQKVSKRTQGDPFGGEIERLTHEKNILKEVLSILLKDK